MVRKSPHQSLTLTNTPPLLVIKYRIQFVLVLTFLMLRLMKRKKYVFQTYTRLHLRWHIQGSHTGCAQVTLHSMFKSRATASRDFIIIIITTITTIIIIIIIIFMQGIYTYIPVYLHQYFPQYMCSAQYGCFLEFFWLHVFPVCCSRIFWMTLK